MSESKGLSEPGAGGANWARERDRLKVLWVVSVVLFWCSVVFQGALYFFAGRLNFILLSIIGGAMILGVVLKFRYQRHLNKSSPAVSAGDDSMGPE